MTTNNDKPASPVSQTKTSTNPTIAEFQESLQSRLATLHDDIYTLTSVYEFYLSAIHAVMSQHEPGPHTTEWKFGLFTINEWLNDATKEIVNDMGETKDWAEINLAVTDS